MNPEDSFAVGELTASDLPPGGYVALGPVQRPFLPWHHPRKQFVRSDQWAAQVEDLLERWPIGDRPLTYLGLPGDDLLDIRYLAKRVCEPRQMGIRYLGLNENVDGNSERKTVVDAAVFAIRTAYETVKMDSEVVSDSFSSLGRTDSPVYKKFSDIGFFDIVNLDLCDGLAKNAPGASSSTNYEAIQRVLGQQFRSTRPWLFFLTTRVGAEHCDEAVRQLLTELLDRNAAECPSFGSRLLDLCGSELEKADCALRELVVGTCGILKWIAQLCVTAKGWKMDLMAVDSYRVVDEAPFEDLFSFAVRFVPLESPVADPLGLGRAIPAQDDECALALSTLYGLRNRRDVDTLLSQDLGLYNKFAFEKGDLLVSAGFDREKYHDYLVNELRLPRPALI